MAQREHDREDLLREATALVERAELTIEGEPQPIVIGFRRDGALSVYFGSDPVYQFNRAGELRRAFVADDLYKAHRGCLIRLRRERDVAATVLVSSELTDIATTEFLSTVAARLQALCAALGADRFVLHGSVPAECDVVARAISALESLTVPLRLANQPGASS